MSPRRPADWRWLGLAALLAAAGLAWVGLTGWMLWGAAAPQERAQWQTLLAPQAALLVLALAAWIGACAALAQRLHERWVRGPARLAEQARVLLMQPPSGELLPQDSPAEQRALASVITELAQQREQLQADMAEQVRQASAGVAQEKGRLAALMAELQQSVVVCNLDGRVLLYNTRARLQFRVLSSAPQLASGADVLGLGRSIYAVLDRQLIAHALEAVRQRMERGAQRPSAQFVTATPGGQLLRVQLAPVREEGGGEASQNGAQALSGFVLMLDNVTREFEQDDERDRLLHGLTEGNRASLANLRAALESLDYPDLPAAMRERLQVVVRDEVQSMTERIDTLSARAAAGIKTRWPLDDMLGADLLAAASQRIPELAGVPVSHQDVQGTPWLRVDSYSLLQALCSLSARLVDEFEVRFVQLRLAASEQTPGKACLDLIWSGHAMSTETVMGWELDPMRLGGATLPLSVRDVVERHGGAFWFERERARHLAFFRFLLPLVAPQESVAEDDVLRADSRPEFYDFDLFQHSDQSRAFDELPLERLSYTVFDTETTGLNPSQGDQIIQIGAVRIVNGRLLRHESFEQLIDPQRSIPPASIPIHGITPDMVKGQPHIEAVLPAFHAYVGDSVLVAHNAAFDMRFLQLQEARTGVVFGQPVLDTLLLSALVHPQQDTHRLEAIAERLGVVIVGRHTALGDAMVTAEVFLRLLPQLHAMGIHTLGQAREAAQKTYLARLNY